MLSFKTKHTFGSSSAKVLLFLQSTGYSRGRKREPDTIVLRGVPSRWFAETRVSSKPSMLVTHTIFSALGRIRYASIVGFVS